MFDEVKSLAESRLIETILDWKQRGQRKGVLFLPLINCSLLPYFFSNCFDFSRVLRQQAQRRFEISIGNEIFFFEWCIARKKEKRERGKKKERIVKSAADY